MKTEEEIRNRVEELRYKILYSDHKAGKAVIDKWKEAQQALQWVLNKPKVKQ